MLSWRIWSLCMVVGKGFRKFWGRWGPPLVMEDVDDLIETWPFSTLLPCRVWSLYRSKLWSRYGSKKVWGRWGSPLKMGRGWPPRNMPSHICYIAEFDRSFVIRYTSVYTYGDLSQKWALCIPPFKVTVTQGRWNWHFDRLWFPVTMNLSHTFSEINGIFPRLKIAKSPLILNASPRSSHYNFVRRWRLKNYTVSTKSKLKDLL